MIQLQAFAFVRNFVFQGFLLLYLYNYIPR